MFSLLYYCTRLLWGKIFWWLVKVRFLAAGTLIFHCCLPTKHEKGEIPGGWDYFIVPKACFFSCDKVKKRGEVIIAITYFTSTMFGWQKHGKVILPPAPTLPDSLPATTKSCNKNQVMSHKVNQRQKSAYFIPLYLSLTLLYLIQNKYKHYLTTNFI